MLVTQDLTLRYICDALPPLLQCGHPRYWRGGVTVGEGRVEATGRPEGNGEIARKELGLFLGRQTE